MSSSFLQRLYKIFETKLGNPDVDGKLLTSTASGVRSWTADYAPAIHSHNARLSLVDLGYMTHLWTYSLPGGEACYSSPIGPITVKDGTTPVSAVVFTGYDWYCYAIKVSDGTLIWRKAAGAPCYGRAQAGDVNADGDKEIFFGSQDGKIYSLSADGSTVRWTFANAYDRASESQGTVTSATSNSITDSTKSWAANTFIRFQGGNEPAAIEILTGTGAGQIRRLATCSGTTLTINTDGATDDYSGVTNVPHSNWTTTPDNTSTYRIWAKYSSDIFFQHGGTLVDESGTYYLYVSSYDSCIYKLNADTGALQWKYATQENVEPPPLVITISGTRYVFTVSVDGKTRCLNASTGALVWDQPLTGPADAFMHAADVDGDGNLELLISTRYSYDTGYGGRVYILNPLTGAVKNKSTQLSSWQYPDIDCAAVPVNVPDVTNPLILTGGDSGTGWCIDGSGNVVWSIFLAPLPINSTPLMHDVKGTGMCALISDMRGTLHSVDVLTGDYLGALYVKGGIEGTALYGDIDSDGKAELVLTTTDGHIHCYRFVNGSVTTQTGHYPGATWWAGKQ